MCLSAKRSYQANERAPSAARNFGHAVVLAALPPNGWSLADDLSIVISELVTIALAGGAPELELSVAVHFDRLEVELAHAHAVAVAAERASGEVDRARRLVLDALTTQLESEQLASGHLRTRAVVRCSPELTTKVMCHFRPTPEA